MSFLSHPLAQPQNSQLPTPVSWQVFEAALAWIRYDRDQRESFLPELLSKIRLPLCRPQFLTDRVQQDDLVRCCHKCRWGWDMEAAGRES